MLAFHWNQDRKSRQILPSLRKRDCSQHKNHSTVDTFIIRQVKNKFILCHLLCSCLHQPPRQQAAKHGGGSTQPAETRSPGAAAVVEPKNLPERGGGCLPLCSTATRPAAGTPPAPVTSDLSFLRYTLKREHTSAQKLAHVCS